MLRLGGRVKTYEAIVKGEPIPQPGVPESFRVLVKELQALGLDMKVLDADKNEIELRDKEDEDEEDGNKEKVLNLSKIEKAKAEETKTAEAQAQNEK